MTKQYNIWWGPPKKFSTQFSERKISWLELFYDLVYVIVISKITGYLSHHASAQGILNYIYLFAITFWGWQNGSQYHDLHGSPGIRTRFMTLWQMLAVGAFAVTLESPEEVVTQRTTVSIIILQIFIIYLWWSVGIYDKQHRKLNIPYTVCYLIALALMIATLFTESWLKHLLFWMTLIANYMPSFITALRIRQRREDFTLSSSMTERLGLLTIIVFGEAILGVINGTGSRAILNTEVWLCFGLGILIVFSLWWIFFSLIADRGSKKGMLNGNAISVLYIPTLASLGMIGASFPALFESFSQSSTEKTQTLQIIYGLSITIFLFSVAAISRFLVYPEEYEGPKKQLQPLVALAGLLNLLLILVLPFVSINSYLLCVEAILLSIIIITTRAWFRVEIKKTS